MDLSYFLALVVLVAAIDLYVHWLIADRQVKNLKEVGKRNEAEWWKFIESLEEAIKK